MADIVLQTSGHIATHVVRLAFAVITPLTVVTLVWATRVYRKAVA